MTMNSSADLEDEFYLHYRDSGVVAEFAIPAILRVALTVIGLFGNLSVAIVTVRNRYASVCYCMT